MLHPSRALKAKLHHANTRGWLRYLVKKQHGKCYYCHEKFTPDNPATLDHYVPLCHGGADSLDNAVAACHKCNHKKGGEMPEQFEVHK